MNTACGSVQQSSLTTDIDDDQNHIIANSDSANDVVVPAADELVSNDESSLNRSATDNEPGENVQADDEQDVDVEWQATATDTQPATDGDEDGSSELTSDENDERLTGTVVRKRRAEEDADDQLKLDENKIGVSDEFSSDDNEDDDDEDDEYIGLIPKLCARCARLLKRSWSEQRSKRYIVVVNVFLSMCGCLLICVGLWMLICKDSLFYGVLLLENVTHPMIVLDNLAMGSVAVGTVLFVVSFLGACGACTECICFLGFHVFLAICCLATQVIFGIVAASLKDVVHANMAASLQYQIRHQYNVSGSRIVNATSLTYRLTSAWDRLQQQLECCGSVGPSDYHYSSWFNHTPDSDGSFVPLSCCAGSHLDSLSYYCQFDAVAVLHNEVKLTVPQRVRSLGCYDAILIFMAKYGSLFALFITYVDILLIIDIISCWSLIRIARRKQSEYSWCDEDPY